MKRLSQTWRQKSKSGEKASKQHAVVNNEFQATSTPSTESQEGTPRRSQRLAKSKSSSVTKKKASLTPSSSGQSCLFNSSFGFEFDADALSAVDKMEKEHIKKKGGHLMITGMSPIIPSVSLKYSLPLTTTCGKATDLQSIPNANHCEKLEGCSELLVERNHAVSAKVPSLVSDNIEAGSGMHSVSSANIVNDERCNQGGTLNRKTSKRDMSATEIPITSIGKTSMEKTSDKPILSRQTVKLTKYDEEKPHIAMKTSNRQTSDKETGTGIILSGKMSENETSNEQTSARQTVGLQVTSNNQISNKEACQLNEETSIHNSRTESCSQGSLSQEQCQLTSWGLPDNILEQYRNIGITTMFEWQAQCLRTGNVLNGGNLVYSAPTSAGKTMVAEILMLKRVLEMKCKALFILPFVSVTREKMFYLQRMFGEAGIKVDGYMGSQVPTKGFDSIDIAVCTIEKANGLVNRLMEAGQLQSVGVIVVDEIHLIGDTSRGYLLELLLTKVLYMSKSTSDSPSERNVQIIGMSATLPNLNVLATWLRADLYFTNYRPVPLTETFIVGPVVYDRSGNVIRELSQSQMVSGDSDHVLVLCQETVGEGNGVLVFCPTKAWCEKLAESIAKHFYTLCSTRLGEPKEGLQSIVQASSMVKFDYDALRDVFEQLRSCQVGLDNVLGKTLRYGVAYHHAGLTYDERDIIEAGFRQGIIKVLVATSTLSSGVNLPARRVIIRTPMFHGKLLDGLVYKQMSGRAGRKGVDSQGESILICKTNERQKARSLFEDELKPVNSCLVVKRSDEDEGNGIKRALLEVIASGVASTPADVQRYASCTFFVSSKEHENSENTRNIINSTVGYLEKNEFITLRKKEDANKESHSSPTECYVPTQLGQATLASSLSPDEALVVFADLREARKCFVLENELHILYQVTPIYVQDHWPNFDWYQYLRLWERLPSHMKRVADLVGIEERFLNRAIRGGVPTRSEAQRHALRVHKRFYVTLALLDLVHEVPLDSVARKYGASRGMLQSLQSSAATFSGMVTAFCRKLGWNNLEMLLSQFQNRLSFGIERELCDLVRISALNAFRARVLYSAGYHTVAAIAAASSPEVEKHLRNATPFQSKKKSEGESEHELRRRMRAKCVWMNGGKALTEAEAAEEIVKEARGLLKEDASKLGMTLKPGVIVPSVREQSSEEQTIVEVDIEKTKILKSSKGPEDVMCDGQSSSTHSVDREDAKSNIAQQKSTKLTTNLSNVHPNQTQSNGNNLGNVKERSTYSSIATCSTVSVVSTSTSITTQTSCNSSTIVAQVTTQADHCENIQFLRHKFSKLSGSPKASTLRKPFFKTHNNTNTVMLPTKELASNTESTLNVKLKNVEEKGRETSKKKQETNRILKRTRTMSNSPKDCHGPKVKLMDQREPPGFRGNSKGYILGPRTLPQLKNEVDDSFYNDCLDNFKVNKDSTPSKRKTKGVLFQNILPVSPKNSPEKMPPSMVVSDGKKNPNELSNTIKAPGRENTSSGHLSHINVADTSKDKKNVDENKSHSKCGNHNSCTKTPIEEYSKQCEDLDESPELITIAKSNDTRWPQSKVPFTGVEYKTTSPNLLVTSPELYSEALFPDYESLPQVSNVSYEMQVDNLSQSGGFESLDISLQDILEEKIDREARGEIPDKAQKSPEQSRRTSDSFSLRLSLSFERAGDSDLSTRTLADVAALEENEMIIKDNLGFLMDNQDGEESQGFQEISNISLETMAAIEAMDDALPPLTLKTSRPCSDGEQEKIKSSSTCETRVPHKCSSTTKKRFTDIKERGTKPVITAKPKPNKTQQIDWRIPNSSFEIIDIAKERDTFDSFVKYCRSNSFSFSVALEKQKPTSSTIGGKFNKAAKSLPLREKAVLAIEKESVAVVGVAFSCKDKQAYYLCLEEKDNIRRNDTVKVSFEERMNTLQCIMGLHMESRVKTAFGVKDQYKVLSRACGVILKGELQDPKIATWLLDPGAREKNFLQLIEHFLPRDSNFPQDIIGGCGHAGPGLATQSSIPARERSCLDAVFSRMLMNHIRPVLEADGFWQAFVQIEMPVVSCLARMELNGFGFSNNECENIKHILHAKLLTLEQEAYRLANRSFSLTSPEEVSRVLFLELKLPPDGDTDASTSPGKTVRPTKGGRRKKVKYFSTSKDVLEKLTTLHPLPKVLLEWRRINCALTKVVFPVQKQQVNCDPPLSMSRIFPSALTHTATGRVTFVEPSLQNVPRDFDINLPTVISDTPPTVMEGNHFKSKAIKEEYTPPEPSSPGPQFSVSLRSAFVPFSNGILLAADYSQLELRLIAHLSGDGKLASFLNTGGDAFRMIAGEIFHIAQDQVSDEQRQRAKHVCYGIIYGIGAKALGQTLAVDVNEAAAFVDAFKARFTGVRGFLKRTVNECRKLGYVTTISGRKRFLPNIRSSNSAAKAQAERQAVNTTVQGSAADLVKLAMANIDRRVCEQFTNCWQTHRQKPADEVGPWFRKRVRREQKFRGANLVLQLHDELIFEVVEQDFCKVVDIVREEMESAMKLSVQLPVKMKSGKSWGTMIPME